MANKQDYALKEFSGWNRINVLIKSKLSSIQMEGQE